ncbi:unnamed protein product [Ixodes pacificus]
METPAVAGAEEAVKALPVPEEVLEVPRPAAEPAAEPKPSDPAVVEAGSSTPAPVQPVPSEPAVVDAKSSESAPVEPEPSELAVADAAVAAPAEKSESTVPAEERSSESTPPQQDDKTESQQDLPGTSQPSVEAPPPSPTSEEAISTASDSANVPSDAVKVVAQQLKDMAIKEDPQQSASTEASAGHDETGISGPPGTVPEPAEPSEKSAKKRRCIIH